MEKDNEALNIENVIETLKLTIDKIGTNQANLQAAMVMVKKYLEKYHLAAILSMYHNGRLLKLMEAVQESQIKDQKRDLSTIYFIYYLAYQCLFAFDQKFIKTYKQLKLQKSEFSKSTNPLPQSQIQNFKLQKNLIKKFNLIKTNDKIQAFEKGVNLRDYILLQLLPAMPKNVFDQVTITWLKKEAHELQSQIFKEKKYFNVGICCHLHFENNVPYLIEGNNSFQVNIKDQCVWQNKKNSEQKTIAEIDSIKKNIVYYLNNEGGYLYVGILTKNKQGKVEGMCGVPLGLEQREKFLKAFQREVVTKIFPTDGENQEEDDQQQQARIKQFLESKDKYFEASVSKTLQFQMSKSISIQFLPLYERESLLYSRDNNGTELFVIRIKVCSGNPAQVYYILNQRELPEAFIQSPTKPLTMIDYYNLVYQKLKDQANHKLKSKGQTPNHICLHNLKYQPEKKLGGNDL